MSMLNPIRNVERSPGPGGPKPGGLAKSFNPARRTPHQYPAQRAPGLRRFGRAKGFDEGGEVDMPDPMDLRSPESGLSPHDAGLKEVVVEAMAALRGESPNPEEAIQAFIDAFGEKDFEELKQMVAGQPEEEEGEEPDELEGSDEEDLAGQSSAPAGMQVGGLLRGPGSGQSDEIEAATPSGRKVLLSDGEYVIDAPTVAALGDGSTNAGARRLDRLRKAIRAQAYGHGQQAKPMKKGGIAKLLDVLNS